MMGDVTIGVGKPGSRSLFGWAADQMGCGYYRMAVPLMAMRENGWLVSSHHALEMKHFLYDAIVAQRTIKSGPTAMLKAAKDSGMPIVMELDDDLFNVSPRNPAYATYSDREYQKNLRDNIVLADGVIVSTEPLAEKMRKLNRNVIVLPNYVDKEIFNLERYEKPTDRLTIGWAGSFTHYEDFQEVKSAIPQILEKYPEVMYHSIGSDYGSEVLKLPEDRTLFHQWVYSVPNYYQCLTFDIGIAPLAATKFNDCKSHIKALEYGCFGIPVVASKYGPYARYIKHGENGFLAKRHSDWIKYLSMLIEDPDMRYEMGQNNRRMARDQTSQANVQERIDFFEEIVSNREYTNIDVAEGMARRLLELGLIVDGDA